MDAASRAGLRYGLAAFAVGFVLGTLRTLLVAPRIGATAAVLLETPLMLAACWPLSRACVRRCAVPSGVGERLRMGAVALVALLACEFLLGVFAFGMPPSTWVAGFASVPGAVGLAAQVAFAALPLLQRRA